MTKLAFISYARIKLIPTSRRKFMSMKNVRKCTHERSCHAPSAEVQNAILPGPMMAYRSARKAVHVDHLAYALEYGLTT